MKTVFKKILDNELPSYTIYEDDIVKVFLDINPITNGDLLLIPKKEIVTIDEIDEELLLHMHKITLKMKTLLEKKLNAKGLTVTINNGYGQDVKHLHFHLTPRYENDYVKQDFNKEVLLDLETVHNKLID